MEVFRVPSGYGQSEIVEKKSRFIGHVWKVENEEQAISHIKDMREQYYDANHNVYCYILKEGGIMRYTDDGEPSGTAGMPALDVFRGQEIYNVCCVVTRYFGGTLLGTGGLVRAYSKTAKLALQNAGISEMRMWTTAMIPCSYGQFERIRREIEKFSGVTEDTDYGAEIVITASFPSENVEPFCARLTEITAGTVTKDSVLITEEAFRPMEIEMPACD